MIRLPKGKMAVVEGLKDYIVIDKDEVLVIIPRDREQEIKEIAARVQQKKPSK